MTTFTIDTDNNITAFAHPQEAEATASGQSFASQDALGALTANWPMDRFTTVWNSFAGVAGFGADLKPVKKFENRDKAVARIWKALQRLNGDPRWRTLFPQKRPTPRPRAPRASVGRASRVGRRPLPRRRPKRDLRLPKAAKPESGAPREGSKTGAVLELLRRKNGASLKEIMKETGWLSHSVRGFLSGTVGKKMGLEVISTTSEGGERRYRISSK